MSKIFDCNDIARGSGFWGREDEVKRLSSNFVFLTNTMLLAPQGWGKTSLIHRAAEMALHKEKSLRFCYFSLSNVRNEERFYELLVQSVLKAVSVCQEDVVENVRKYFPNICPRVTFTAGPVFEFSVDFDWEDIRHNQDELLNIPCIIAKDKDVKLVVCVDDIHAVSLFDDPESFLERVRGRWSRHDGVSYCVSGAMLSVVEKFVKNTPMFYRYGDVIRLGKIRRSDMIKGLRESFADSAKYLDNETAAMIIDLAEGYPFHIMQLANAVWSYSSVVCSQDVVKGAYETILDQMKLVFENYTAALTTQQLCYLHAVLAGETVISTSEVLHRHHITSATSASRSKTALLERGVICNVDGKICFTDPTYAKWLKSRYFR